MKIAHLADLHLGYSHLSMRDSSGRNQRAVDFERAALLCAERLCQDDIDVVVVAGDLLHDTNLYPAALSGAVEFCRMISAKKPLLAIGGNHDEAEGIGRYNALRFLRDHAGLELHLEQGYRDIEDLRLHLVSYRVLSRAHRGRSSLEPFVWKEGGQNVLVAHGYAPGAGVPTLPPDAETEIPSKWLTDSRFDACLLGHVHVHTELAPGVFYAGSTERRNFGEAAQRPAFWLHDFSGKRKSKSIYLDELGDAPRKMLDLSLDTKNLSLRELDQRVLSLLEQQDLAGALMRLRLENVAPDLDRSQSVASWTREFRRLEGMLLEVVVQTKQVAELLDLDFAKAPDDVGDGFIDFLSQQKLPRRTETLAAAEELVAETRERMIAQETD